jgi:hypothetical protein
MLGSLLRTETIFITKGNLVMNEMVDSSPRAPVTSKQVTVVDIDIPFGRLVSILVKVAIAAVPAAIIVAIFWVFLAAILAGVIGGLHR